MNPPEADEFQSRLARLESLIQQSERLPEPGRSHTREIVQALLDLHAVGLERLLDHVFEAGEPGGSILDACSADDVVSGLLLLHGLHPLSLEDRVRQSLAGVQPFLHSHGGNAELIGVEGEVVRVRIGGNCGCASSGAAMRRAVEEAIAARAPDAVGVEMEGLEADKEGGGRVALPLV